MAAYRKTYRPQITNLPKFDVSREMSEESSLTYASSSFAPQSHNSTPTTTTFENTIAPQQVPFPIPQINNGHFTSYTASASNIPTPRVVSYQPQNGQPGTQVLIHITSLTEAYQASPAIFFLEFGSTRVHAVATQLEGRHSDFIISGKAPPVSLTEWQTSHTPLTIILEDEGGRQLFKADIGIFEYEDDLSSSTINSLGVGEDRPFTSAESVQNIMTRQMSNNAMSETGFPYCFTPTTASQFYPSSTHNTTYSVMPEYDGLNSDFRNTINTNRHLSQYAPSATPTTMLTQSRQSMSSTWPSYSLQHTGTTASRPSYMSRPALAPPMGTNPALVRTTALSQQGGPGVSTTHGSGYKYPFSSITDTYRAQLQLMGNLEAMANVCDWEPEEIESKRRIVMFKRSQHGSKITATFQPVIGEKPPQNSVCVSCIFWEDKKDCFVTSVDTIYLLESLAGSKFPTDEKNRIRRNMEGYHPLTVSKGKADSEEFFKTIMGFPNPKPRNIEKDIKVFSWKILSGGLKKIIGKYSAAPSPNVLPPPLLTPSSSYGNDSRSNTTTHSTQSGHDHPDMYSQQSTYSSGSSRRSLSGQSHGQYSSMSRPISPEDVKSSYNVNNEMQMSVNPYYHQQQDQYPQPPIQANSFLNPILTPPARDPSWDLGMVSGSYIDTYATHLDTNNPRNPGLADYGGNHTPTGVSIPKLLGMGGSTDHL